MKSIILAIITATVCAGSSYADGLVYQIPDDGVAADYSMKMEIRRRGQKDTITGAMRIASVGIKLVNGQKCRWIEFVLQMKKDGKKASVVAKFLIPEKHLGTGKRPLAHAISGWLKGFPQKPKEIRNFQSEDIGPFAIFLSEPLADKKNLKKAKVETSFRKFDCRVTKGKTYFKPDNDRDSLSAEITNYHHPNSPFGVVKSQIQIQMIDTDKGEINGNISMHFELQGVEKNVKSKLPDYK